MIWQLIKLDPTWMWTAILSLVSVFFCALGGSFIVAALLLFGCGVIVTQSTDAGFYAALPVTPRQVYLERTLSVNLLLWLPLAINGEVFMLGPHGNASGGSVIAIGSVSMLALQAIQTAKFRQRNAPAWLAGAPFAILWAFSMVPKLPGLVTPGQIWLLRHAERTTAPVVVTCWLLTGILFARGVAVADWFVPEQAQPATRPVRGSVTRFSYMFRIFISSSYLWIVYFVIAALLGLRLSDDLSSGATLLIVFWDWIGRKVRWMSFLPISPRALLAGILLPAIAAVAAGYEIGLRIPVARLPLLRDLAGTTALAGLPGPRDQIAGVIVMTAGLMMMTLMSMAQNWKSFGGRTALWLGLLIPSVVVLNEWRKLAGYLPAGLPAAIAVGTICLGLLYWALDAVFRQLEFIDKPAAGEGA